MKCNNVLHTHYKNTNSVIAYKIDKYSVKN